MNARPDYRELCRSRYAAKKQSLKDQGFVPLPRGRPRLHIQGSEEELEARRRSNRIAQARYKSHKLFSHDTINNESTSSNFSEEANR